MSKVYGFRLDENNPREAQAREAIEAWVSKGYSLRQIIIDALIQYGNNRDRSEELDILLKQLRELIDQGSNRQILDGREGEDTEALPSSFLEGIRKSMKSGVDVE